ncbi:uncharacterized protein STEHIDRAFT_151992 [Stereum hirsutum FP-91666 SS1]|uniref:uncharacterized protein n=1 Tax=Stereum hirsutum (strain FP-91666) TaxID=721885 RepID=UPI000440E3D6|nr:uncharacterized protein STEHIDRAFT_151992 [Stereum hirsutum FP-91666 SS1]EIM92683.1 hypothetical protein STEHIDRAFT_151992 [Stereum hirsutum FP-91666 SS1]
MSVQGVELQKQRYAEELRRHTLRQWTLARESLEQAQGRSSGAGSPKSPSPESSPKRSGSRTHSSTGGSGHAQPFQRIKGWFQ